MLLGGGSALEQLPEDGPPRCLGPRARQLLDAGERRVHLLQRHARRRLLRWRESPQRGVADTDRSLRQLSGQERHRSIDLIGLQAPQAARQQLDFGAAA